jgi:hypothetical protein
MLTNRKRKKLPRYTQPHGISGMKTWLKLNCSLKFVKKAKAKLSVFILKILKYINEKKIYKSENHENILHKSGYNLVKKGPI